MIEAEETTPSAAIVQSAWRSSGVAEVQRENLEAEDGAAQMQILALTTRLLVRDGQLVQVVSVSTRDQTEVQKAETEGAAPEWTRRKRKQQHHAPQQQARTLHHRSTLRRSTLPRCPVQVTLGC